MNDTMYKDIHSDHDMVLLCAGHSNMLLAITLPLVLICVVLALLTASVTFVVLVRSYRRATKKDNLSVKSKQSQDLDELESNTTNEIEVAYYTTEHEHDLKETNETEDTEVYYSTVKSARDAGPNVTNENEYSEVFYNTIIDLSKCAVDPQIIKMEENSAYGNVRCTEELAN